MTSTPPPHPAVALVTDYLRTMERRDLTAAHTLLAPGFHLVFPGGRRFDSIEALVASAGGRYRRALKDFERFDVAPKADGSVVVYCFGTLYGEWADGTPFSGIRYIDRFTVRDGKLVDTYVWNDLAEAMLARDRA